MCAVWFCVSAGSGGLVVEQDLGNVVVAIFFTFLAQHRHSITYYVDDVVLEEHKVVLQVEHVPRFNQFQNHVHRDGVAPFVRWFENKCQIRVGLLHSGLVFRAAGIINHDDFADVTVEELRIKQQAVDRLFKEEESLARGNGDGEVAPPF